MKIRIEDIKTMEEDTRYWRDRRYYEVLKEDIVRHGMKVPLLVWRDEDGKYVLMEGRYRYDILKEIGEADVEVKLLEGGKAEALVQAFKANYLKKRMGPLDIFQHINIIRREAGWEYETIAKKIGISPRLLYYIRQIVEKAELSTKMKLARGQISLRQALREIRGERVEYDRGEVCEERQSRQRLRMLRLCPECLEMVRGLTVEFKEQLRDRDRPTV